MRTIKKVLILVSCVLILTSCKTSQVPVKEVAIKTETKIVERLVPVHIPADSSALFALLECDSLNNVRLVELNELKTKGMQSELSLVNNQLNYNTKTKRDTVYLPAKDIIIERDVPVYIDVPFEVNKLSDFQIIQLWGFRIILVFFAIYLAFKRLF